MTLVIIYLRYLSKIILFVVYFGVFAFMFYAFRLHYINLYFSLYPNPFYSYFSELTFFIYTVNIVIVFGFFTTIIEIISAYFNSTAKFAIAKRKAYIHKLINDTIFQHLSKPINNDSDANYIKYINKTFKTDYSKLVFINRLRRIMSLTTGEVHEHCIRLFRLMHSESLLKSYILSPYKRHKLFSLRVIGDFNLANFQKTVARLIRKKDIDISSEAIYTYIKICPDTNLNFLIKNDRQISRLNTYNIIQLVENYKNIDYRSLINAELTTLSALGLRLASIHNETELKPEILKKIDHQNEQIRSEAQRAFLNMLEVKDIKTLIARFDIFNKENKQAIIDLLGEYGLNKETIYFFEEIIEKKDNYLKFLAMNKLLQNDFMQVVKYKKHSDENIRKVYKQLTDFNL